MLPESSNEGCVRGSVSTFSSALSVIPLHLLSLFPSHLCASIKQIHKAPGNVSLPLFRSSLKHFSGLAAAHSSAVLPACEPGLSLSAPLLVVAGQKLLAKQFLAFMLRAAEKGRVFNYV